MSDIFDEAKEVEKKATPLPWNWTGEDNDYQLEGNIEDREMCPVLVPHRCEACRKRGALCMAPTEADRDAIVFYRNNGPRLAKALQYAMTQLSGSRGALEEINLILNGEA